MSHLTKKEELLEDMSRVRKGEKRMITLYVRDHNVNRVKERFFCPAGRTELFDAMIRQVEKQFDDELRGTLFIHKQIIDWRVGDSIREIEDGRKE